MKTIKREFIFARILQSSQYWKCLVLPGPPAVGEYFYNTKGKFIAKAATSVPYWPLPYVLKVIPIEQITLYEFENNPF